MQHSAPLVDLSSLRQALASPQRALVHWNASQGQDEELHDACIQRFEYSFELSWKMLKRRLEIDLPDGRSLDAMSFRDLVRVGAERGLLAEVAAIIPSFADQAQGLLARLDAVGAKDA